MRKAVSTIDTASGNSVPSSPRWHEQLSALVFGPLVLFRFTVRIYIGSSNRNRTKLRYNKACRSLFLSLYHKRIILAVAFLISILDVDIPMVVSAI